MSIPFKRYLLCQNPMYNYGVIGIESWTISHTFTVIFATTAPHPRWRRKPCNGLLMYESNPRVPMPPPPGWPLGIWHFFFRSNSPPCRPFLWSNAPLPRDFLGVKCLAPRAEVTKPRLISGNLNDVFNTAISIIFVYQFNVYVHFFSVYIATT